MKFKWYCPVTKIGERRFIIITDEGTAVTQFIEATGYVAGRECIRMFTRATDAIKYKNGCIVGTQRYSSSNEWRMPANKKSLTRVRMDIKTIILDYEGVSYLKGDDLGVYPMG